MRKRFLLRSFHLLLCLSLLATQPTFLVLASSDAKAMEDKSEGQAGEATASAQEKYTDLNPKTSWLGAFLDNNPSYASFPIVKQDENSIHFQKPNGVVEAQFSERPIQYQDKTGDWQPIDTALKQNGDTFEGLGTVASIKTDGTVTIKDTDHTYKTTGYGWYNPETKTFTPIQDLPQGETEENKFIRKDKEFKHILTLLDTGLKEEMTI